MWRLDWTIPESLKLERADGIISGDAVGGELGNKSSDLVSDNDQERPLSIVSLSIVGIVTWVFKSPN